MPGVGSGGSPVLAGSGPTGMLSAVAMGRSAGTSGLLGGSGIAGMVRAGPSALVSALAGGAAAVDFSGTVWAALTGAGPPVRNAW